MYFMLMSLYYRHFPTMKLPKENHYKTNLKTSSRYNYTRLHSMSQSHHPQDTEQVWKDMHWLDSAVQIGRKSDTIHGVPLRSLRKNPMTSQPQSRSSSMSFTTSPEKKKELPNGQHPSNPAHFEKHISTFPEELKVTPLYDTGLTKGSTVKVCNSTFIILLIVSYFVPSYILCHPLWPLR